MADKRKKTILDKAFPIRDTNDILYRGMWGGPVVSDKFVDRLPFRQRLATKILMRIGARWVEKSRQPVPAFTFDRGVKPRLPPYRYDELIQLSKTHWLLRQIFRAIIGEVINPRWTIQPKFKRKCATCGKEYNSPEVEQCEICEGTQFTKPDYKQYIEAERLLREPGQDRTFVEFIRSTLWYLLALDDAYWEIGYSREYDPDTKKIKRVPRGIRVLDAAITQPVMDEFGNFNSTQYFCPVCYLEQYRETKQDTYVDIRSLQDQDPKKLKCKRCGEPLVQTGYIQKIGGNIIARWGKDEIVHVSSSRIDPEPYGQSKIVACLKHLMVINFMDEYNLQIYSHGHVNKLVVFPGADKSEIKQIERYIKNQLESKHKLDPQTGEAVSSLEPIMIFLGTEEGKNPDTIDLMVPLDQLQSIDYYRLYVEKVSGVFGVTPTFVSVTEGREGTISPRMELDVQNRVTRGYMKDIEDPFNNQLLPRLGITDWVLKFGKVESRDELRVAQIRQTNAMAVSILRSAGFEVEVAEDMMAFTVNPKATMPPQPRSRMESGRIPQDLDGAPTRTMPSGSETGVPIQEPEVSEYEK